MPPTKEASTVTPVLNNCDGIRQIALPAIQGKGGITPGPVIHLYPGMNFPETALWDKAKQNELAQQLLTSKIELSKAPEFNPERVGMHHLVEYKPVSKDNPLAAMSESEAVVMVGEILDTPTLKRFQLQETRPLVGAALKAQLAKIEKPEAKKAS